MYLHAFATFIDYYRLIFDKVTDFGLVGLFYQRKGERKGGNLRDTEEGDKEDVGWKERKGAGRETDQIEWRTML